MVICSDYSAHVSICIEQYLWISCFTDIVEVAVLAEAYKEYVLVYPLVAGIGLALYGMFTGATYTAPVRNMMIMALAVFCWQSAF